MIGEIIKTNVFYEFKIGDKRYVYINIPISARTCTGSGKSLVVSGSDNFLSLKEKMSDLKQSIESVTEAFALIEKWKYLELDEGYNYGTVKDYNSKTMYYDNDQALEAMGQRNPEEFAFFENKIKVEDWSNAENYVKK